MNYLISDVITGPVPESTELIPAGTGVPIPGPDAGDWWAWQWHPGLDMPFSKCTALGLDTETEPLEKGALINPVSLQIAGDRTNEVVFVAPEDYDAALAYISTTYPDIKWVFFNAPFDCRVLGWPKNPLWSVLENEKMVDMEIRAILYYLQEGTYAGVMNLGELSRRALNWELNKDDGLQLSFRQNQILTQAQIQYASQDSIATVLSQAKMPQQMPTEQLNIKGYFALSDISYRGMRVDMEELQRLSKLFMEEQKRVWGMLQLFGIAPGDPGLEGAEAMKGGNRRKQELLLAVEEQYQVPGAEKKFKLPRTKTGAIGTEKKTLDLALITRNIKIPTWLDLSRTFDHARKMRKTYLNPAMIGVDGRVHPRFSPLMRTGRTSASKPNTQNPPKDGGVRGIYVPKPGYLFLATDFNQLELCALAQSCWTRFGKSRMRELINDGVDLHFWFGDVIAQKAGIFFTEDQAESKERIDFRTRAKATNFGYPGGLGAATFVAYARNYKINISIEQAKELKEIWLDAFPEMRQHLQPEVDQYWTNRNIQVWLSQNKYAGKKIYTLSELEAFLVEEGYDAEFVYGICSELSAYECRLVSGRLKRNCTYCAATNMQFQGPSADGAKIGLWDGYTRNWRIVNFVHDEVIQEVPVSWTNARHSEFADEVEEVLCADMMKILPDVKVKAESVLMPRWYKEAKKLVDENGYLMVWTPEEAERRKQMAEAAKLAAETTAA
jgi:DNA polymerase I-like protein with 3'-5' exonuclease and polymerase domains